jgi:serine/threonine protein kinase
MISFQCICGRRLKASDDKAGQEGQCPDCGRWVPIPDPAADPKPSAPSQNETVTAPPPVAEGETLPPPPAAAFPQDELPVIPGYQVLSELGRGGMGVIYKARQEKPRRFVALKMILAGDYAGADHRARFRTEAEAVAKLQHANIVQVHEVGEHEGRPFLTLEYVEGGNLAQHLKSKPLPPRRAAALLYDLARAVQHAHKQGIVHRDLKPANILLTLPEDENSSLGTPKIADFGLAKQLDAMTSVKPSGPQTQSGAIVGTPNYMAPEQAGGKTDQIGPAADVYALGAILYETLTGQPPFQAATTLDTIVKVVSEDPVPVRQLRPKVPRDLETICLKCLRKEPKDRYASARDLADDLQRFLNDQAIVARPQGKVERLRRWLKRRRELVYLTGGALAVLGISLLVLFLLRSPGSSGQSLSELPPDLQLIPRDAFLFSTFRLSELWERHEANDLEKQLPLQALHLRMRDMAEMVEKDTSIHPLQIERATVVVLRSPERFFLPFQGPDKADSGDSLAFILSTSRPYSHEAFRATMLTKKNHQPKDYDGKTIYQGPKIADGFAYCAFSDKILLVGETKALELLLDRAAHVKDDGPLRGALSLAAEKHLLVLGVHPHKSFTKAMSELPGFPKVLQPLLELESASLVLDFPAAVKAPITSAQLDLRLSFGDEDKTRNMIGPVDELRKFLLDGLDQAAKEHGGYAAFFKDVLAPARTFAWQQQGKELCASIKMEWKAEALAAATLDAEESGPRRQSNEKLKKIASALSAYHAKHGRFPPAVKYSPSGQALYSWRVLILPQLGQVNLYQQFHLDEPWDSKHNLFLLQQIPEVFRGPFLGNKKGKPPEWNSTPYQVVIGPGTAFERRDGTTLTEISKGGGADKTLLVVEAEEFVPWSKPADLRYVPGQPLPRLGLLKSGFQAIFADSSVRYIPRTTAEATLRSWITNEADKGGKKP